MARSARPIARLVVRGLVIRGMMLGGLALPPILGQPAFAIDSAAAPYPADPAPDANRLAALVEQLGSPEAWLREAAATELRAIGAPAIDSLLAAAESSGDLEISLAARWLIDAIPLTSPSDPPEVASLVGRLGRGGLAETLDVMQRLLRIDDGAGIEPLARIVRMDRSPAASVAGAALLAGEWTGDPDFEDIAAKAARGLGASTRPTAAFLRGLIDWEGGRMEGIDAAVAAMERIRSASPARPGLPRRPGLGGRAARTGEAKPQEAMLEDPLTNLPVAATVILERKLAEMLAAAGRRDEAATIVHRLFEASREEPDDLLRSYRIGSTLAWAGAIGAGRGVDALRAAHPQEFAGRPIAMYAAALALKSEGRVPEAESLALEARDAAAENPRLHLDAASKLVHWGCVDWAIREYERLLEEPSVPDSEFVLASVMCSEFFHDLGRDDEAAACLRRLLENPGKDRAAPDELLREAGREPRSTRSRMLYFEACAAESKGDRTAERSLLDRAIDGDSADVDAIIAAYRHPDAAATLRRSALDAIRRAVERLETEIDETTEEGSDLANACNEYAWLVANTEGDAERAVRRSKRSLEISFDNASYLDTLAHAHAADGRLDRAIRVQSIAARHEPHNRTIRRNLERFRALAAGSGKAGERP